MVRALLEGRKTQTRRALRAPYGTLEYLADESWRPICTKVYPGDRLWVKETWSHTGTGVWTTQDVLRARDGKVIYRADDEILGAGWFPSIFMFRHLSRLTLTVTDVRVQRLQDISEADAIAEGIELSTEHPNCWKRGKLTGDQNFVTVTGCPKLAFRSIWESINGPDAWYANPWIYAISFDVQRGNIDQMQGT